MDGFFIVLLAMLAVFYFLLIRPQRQQQRRQSAMLNALKVGDEVITAGGVYGEVVALDVERVMLEIDDDVQIAVSRRAITSIVPPEELRRLEDGEEAQPAEANEAGDPVREQAVGKNSKA